MKLRYLTAGESHGKGLTGIIEGMPAGLPLVAADHIDPHMKRRQGGYGRGGRMKIESDRAEIFSGVRWGITLGSPIALSVINRDFKNWQEGMGELPETTGSLPPVTRPRPGHADLPGVQKYDLDDVRNVLERSSARETAMRVAVGSVARQLLEHFGITIGSFVMEIGSERIDDITCTHDAAALKALFAKAEASDLRCPDDAAAGRMRTLIDQATKEGNSLGGVFAVYATDVPPGLGSHVHWDRRLDGRLAQSLMSIQAIKGVEVGLGFEAARRFGSAVMDEILPSESAADQPYVRAGNNAGGIEGGISNGMPILLRAAMKPIPTLRSALRSVDIRTGEVLSAAYERSDVCAVPAAAVIGEAMAALTLADAFLEKFGGDSIREIERNLAGYREQLRR